MKQWFVAYKERGTDLFDLDNLTVVQSPIGTYFADPFLLKRGAETWLFVEQFDNKKGVIAAGKLGGEMKVVLETDYHISYPAVFEHDGEFYMTPETGANMQIELWKAKNFPNDWELVNVIDKRRASGDPQHLFYDDKHYLFVTVPEDNKLEIFITNDLEGEWRLHSRHDIINSRSAGSIFFYGDKLLRPVQDCSEIYGGAIIFKEIQLTPFKYEEEIMDRVEPKWLDYLIGTHTFNATDGHVVIDGKYDSEIRTP